MQVRAEFLIRSESLLLRDAGWLTKFFNPSFINVVTRGQFQWENEGLYQDEDGTLSGQHDSIIMAPAGISNASVSCTPVSNFVNAIRCPFSEGPWLRIDFKDLSCFPYACPRGALLISNEYGHSISVSPFSQGSKTPVQNCMTLLRVNQTYRLDFNSIQVRD